MPATRSRRAASSSPRVRSNRHEQYAIVTWETQGHNQHGERVIVYRRSNLVRRAR